MKKFLTLALALVLICASLTSCFLDGAGASINPLDIVKSLDEEAYAAELLITDSDMLSVASYYHLNLDKNLIEKLYCVLVVFPLDEYKDTEDKELAIYIFCEDKDTAEELEETIDAFIFDEDFPYIITNPQVKYENGVIRVGSKDTFDRIDEILEKAD